jgi:hypothetical protein
MYRVMEVARMLRSTSYLYSEGLLFPVRISKVEPDWKNGNYSQIRFEMDTVGESMVVAGEDVAALIRSSKRKVECLDRIAVLEAESAKLRAEVGAELLDLLPQPDRGDTAKP